MNFLSLRRISKERFQVSKIQERFQKWKEVYKDEWIWMMDFLNDFDFLMNFSGDKWCVSCMMISLMCDDESFELFMMIWCCVGVLIMLCWYVYDVVMITWFVMCVLWLRIVVIDVVLMVCWCVFWLRIMVILIVFMMSCWCCVDMFLA